MNIQSQKLELMQLLLNTNSEEALKKIERILKRYSIQTETEYLLSTEANRNHLAESINELNEGKGKPISTDELWK